MLYSNFRFRVNEKAKNKKPSAEKGKDRSRNKTTPKHTVKQKLSKTDQKGKKVSETDKKIQQKSKDSVNTTAPARMNTSADSMLADTSVASESVLDQTGLFLFEPRSEKTGLRGFRPGQTQTGLYNHRRWLGA